MLALVLAFTLARALLPVFTIIFIIIKYSLTKQLKSGVTQRQVKIWVEVRLSPKEIERLLNRDKLVFVDGAVQSTFLNDKGRECL